jgi:hypothetical protein
LKQKIGNGDAKQKAEATTDHSDRTHVDAEPSEDESQHRTGDESDNQPADGGENPKNGPRFQVI